MGIKSTRTLKRSEALRMYESLLEEMFGVRTPSNKELSDILEILQDMRAERDGTTNFDNYCVVDE